jgi:hypothetical protein
LSHGPAAGFVFNEVFANQDDFEAHNNMLYVQAWFAKLPDLAEGGGTALRLEILAEPGASDSGGMVGGATASREGARRVVDSGSLQISVTMSTLASFELECLQVL